MKILGCGEEPAIECGWVQVPQAKIDAHFHAVHLIAIVTKLLPEWLPQPIFDMLLRLWKSQERRSRHAPIPTRSRLL